MHRTTITQIQTFTTTLHAQLTLLNTIDATRFTDNKLLTRDHNKLPKHISNYLLNFTTFRENNKMYKERLYIAIALSSPFC